MWIFFFLSSQIDLNWQPWLNRVHPCLSTSTYAHEYVRDKSSHKTERKEKRETVVKGENTLFTAVAAASSFCIVGWCTIVPQTGMNWLNGKVSIEDYSFRNNVKQLDLLVVT